MLKQKALMGKNLYCTVLDVVLYLCAGHLCLYRNAHGRSSPPADSECVSPTENQLVKTFISLKVL